MSDLLTVRNITATPQSVVFQGRQIVLGKYETQRMEAALAGVFLERCAPMVEEVQAETETFNPEGSTDVWIANVTGNPKYPAFVKLKTLQNKKWVMDDMRNSSATPAPVTRDWDAGMEAYTGKDGSFLTKNLPKLPVTVAPFQRRRLRKDIADWFLQRESHAVAFTQMSRAVIRSRAPTLYEPDMEWDLNEVRAYVQVISSGQEQLGPTEEQLMESAKDSIEFDTKVNEAKRALLKTAWFYICDPAYRLPSKNETRELLKGNAVQKQAVA